MQVRETNLGELLAGVKQFRVPLFQRPYTWDEENHSQLWQDILGVYESAFEEGHRLPLDSVSGHFLGSFVLAPHAGSASGLSTFLVVDGQQRLTTLTLALCALRDQQVLGNPEARDRINETFLVNRWKSGDDRYRLLPARQDRPSYVAAVDDLADKGGTDPIGSAYRFFAARMAESSDNGDPIDLELLERVLVSRLLIVDITAQQGDNVHRIFESLNATGVSLTQADLLRNYFMMLLPTRADAVYDEVWYPMQRSLGPGNLEALARVDLQRRGTQVRTDDVYRMQQRRLRDVESDEAAVEAEIRDLALRAIHYERILDPAKELDPDVATRLGFLDRWGAQTAHPLVMYLFELRQEGAIDAAGMERSLWHIESFLVRRLLTGASRKNLNRIFPQVVRRIRVSDVSIDIPCRIQKELSGERLYWASDDALQAAMESEPFYFYGRGSQRRMVLEKLEESFEHKEQLDLSTAALSIEHIMPQTLTDEWRDLLASYGDDPESTHAELKHTIGNLTLTGYNSELSNKPYERKHQIYQNSHLSLNRDLAEEGWSAGHIRRRSSDLASRAIQIWGPPADVPSVESGPAWGRMHAAIAAIPAGKWTSYGDLAELIGTSPQAVGTHIGANLSLFGSHRVLTSGGVISEGFRWQDPADDRDPVDVLTAEGLKFDEDKADPNARVSAEELADEAGLLEEYLPDESDELGTDWDEALVLRCYRESPPAMKAVLELLASQPGRTFMSNEIAQGIERTGTQMAGVFGAFGNRVRNRYSMGTWPFDAQWSDPAGMMMYRMPDAVARVVSRAVG